MPKTLSVMRFEQEFQGLEGQRIELTCHLLLGSPKDYGSLLDQFDNQSALQGMVIKNSPWYDFSCNKGRFNTLSDNPEQVLSEIVNRKLFLQIPAA